MLAVLAARAELFHTDNGAAFADLMIGGHRETWHIRSLRFRSWLRRPAAIATRNIFGSLPNSRVSCADEPRRIPTTFASRNRVRLVSG